VNLPEWLAEAMMTTNQNVVTKINEESLTMTPFPMNITNDGIFHPFVDVGGVEEHNGVGNDEILNGEDDEEEA
jgi:hypothetical protein